MYDANNYLIHYKGLVYRVSPANTERLFERLLADPSAVAMEEYGESLGPYKALGHTILDWNIDTLGIPADQGGFDPAEELVKLRGGE